MVTPVNLRVEYSCLYGNARNRIISSFNPIFSWGAITDQKNDFQSAYHLKVFYKRTLMWDSGIVKTDKPYAKYEGCRLPVGKRINFCVSIAGNDGVFSDWVTEYFYIGTFDKLPEAKWICASDDAESVPAYFNTTFEVDKDIDEAALFVSGIGYNDVKINGAKIDDSSLDPGISEYHKTCYYSVIPDIDRFIVNGTNSIDITVADGWRRNCGEYLSIYNNNPTFFGMPCLWAALRINYTDGTENWIYTDETWKWGRGPVIFSHLFDGEIYDSRVSENPIYPVKLYTDDIGKLKPMTIPPIVHHKTFEPQTIQFVDGKYIVDFGTNLSGVARIKLPSNMTNGQKITLRHAQLLHDNGTLNTDNLRGAKCEDTYIASGDGSDLEFYQPTFTYHGFRYVEVSGLPLLQKENISAIMLCTDLKPLTDFKSGNTILNKIHEMALQTEFSTTHSAFNDTCGRSERMSWVGTARYGEISYNFEIGKMFPHVMELIRDTQNDDGSITCTAPYIYGNRPADPQSSTYLLLAEYAYNLTGNIDVIAEHYDCFCAWQKCLLKNTEDFIMTYSHYGDWAGPEYSRDHTTKGGGAGSATIPPVIVGTALLMDNARRLARFASLLGQNTDVTYYNGLFENIKNAFLNKWYDSSTCKLFNGSQSCQAIVLWLDILPEDDAVKAAKIMRDDLVESDYHFTTGVYCSNYMCDMLVKYGYIDEFYTLLTRDTYPSFGYMLQCGATTCWEKFEYIAGSSMNAHIHPDQTSIAQFLYKYLGGVVPIGEGASEFDIKPYYPSKLLSASITYQSVRGDISVRWRKVDGYTNLCVNVPFNTKAHIHTKNGIKTVGSGFYSFNW